MNETKMTVAYHFGGLMFAGDDNVWGAE